MKISYLKAWRALRQLGIRPLLVWRNRNMAMTAYPDALPLDCFRTVVQNIRQKTVVENKAEFAHCLWNVQGYAQSMLLGAGGVHGGFGAGPVAGRTAPEDDDNLKEVASALQDYEGEMAKSENFATAMATAPPEHGSALSVITQLVPAVLQLLIQLGVIKTAGDAPRTGVRHGQLESEQPAEETETRKTEIRERKK